MKGRGILLVVLLYFSLDISVPEIPGAFMFEADDSVEVSMTSETFVTDHMPRLPAVSFVVPPVAVDRPGRLAVSGRHVSPNPPVRLQLPRATVAVAPDLEDSH